MGAVTSVWVISTVNQSVFRSSTPHIIQKYLTTPPTKMSSWKGRCIYVHQTNIKWSMHSFCRKIVHTKLLTCTLHMCLWQEKYLFQKLPAFTHWILSILVACRLRWHQLFPTDHHIQYPMLHSGRLQHVPQDLRHQWALAFLVHMHLNQ